MSDYLSTYLHNKPRAGQRSTRSPQRIKELPIDPAAQFILRKLQGHFRGAEIAAGLGDGTIRVWLYRPQRFGPGISMVRAILNHLGYDLLIVPLEQTGKLTSEWNRPDAVQPGKAAVLKT